MQIDRILVTGGAGFLGSNLCEKLLNMNKYVICVDNLLTGKKENITKFITNKNFKFIEHDITNSLDIEVDEIYNLACPASPVHYQKNSFETIQTNVLGVINMLELAKKYNAKILQASTSEVYGNPLEHPQKETYYGNVNITGPRACYDEGKRCAETLFLEYNKKYKLKIKIARIFNTYGPNMCIDDGRVVSNFIVQALNNKNLTINVNGMITRSFCYVSDLLNGLVKLMNSSSINANPVNLGNPNEITLLELANTVINLTNSNSNIIFNEIPIDDPLQRKPNIMLATHLLNWIPEIELHTGLLKTIKYFKE